MIFVTTGQRIAVENFSKGVIYKVAFTDESISYMMCVGIGKDFVMLESANPSLFALTMQSASRVSTIDIHDPTPPEPPTPLENVLQYQTGAPPFTFTTTESSLFSWYIEGAAGVKTANLTIVTQANSIYSAGYDNYSVSNNTVTATGAALFGFITPVQPNTTYTCQSETTNRSVLYRIREYSGMPTEYTGSNYIQQIINQNYQGGNTATFTTSSETTYILFAFYVDPAWSPATLSKIMVNKGSTALPYEESGKYKISIFTNEHTTTIYLDEPIGEGEKLYSVNIDAQIETDIGENTLSVSDPQPPEMQIIYGIYAEG